MADYMLETKNLGINFGGLKAVDNVNLKIKKQQLYGLVGPNGAGKTTVFNMLTGVYQPTSGTFYLDGEELSGMTQEKINHKGIARTFQNIRLFKSMTVFENVLVAMHLRRKSNIFTATFKLNLKEENEMRRKAEELLKIVDLYDLKDELATSLPYGKQRRLEIARALATEPKLLLLDEPAAGMNPQETDELTAFIHDIRSKFDLTILLIEHHMNLVMDISDRIYVIDFGKLISSGTPDVVQSDKKVIDAYLGVAENE